MRYILVLILLALGIQVNSLSVLSEESSRRIAYQELLNATARSILIEEFGEAQWQRAVDRILQNNYDFNRLDFLKNSTDTNGIVAYMDINFTIDVEGIDSTPEFVDMRFDTNSIENWNKVFNRKDWNKHIVRRLNEAYSDTCASTYFDFRYDTYGEMWGRLYLPLRRNNKKELVIAFDSVYSVIKRYKDIRNSGYYKRFQQNDN